MIAFFACPIGQFALAKRNDAVHKELAFQASSPKTRKAAPQEAAFFLRLARSAAAGSKLARSNRLDQITNNWPDQCLILRKIKRKDRDAPYQILHNSIGGQDDSTSSATEMLWIGAEQG